MATTMTRVRLFALMATVVVGDMTTRSSPMIGYADLTIIFALASHGVAWLAPQRDKSEMPSSHHDPRELTWPA